MSAVHADHHVKPVSLYIATFIKLAILMGLTIFAAQLPTMFPNSFLGTTAQGTVVMNVIALTIACLKAGLVVSIFMGVKFGTKLTKLYAVTGFVWVIFIMIMMIDYTTRHFEQVKGWDSNRPTSLPRSSIDDKREFEETGPAGPMPTFR